MDAQKVEVRSVNQDTETILSIFKSRMDRPGVVIEYTELLAALGLQQKNKWYDKVVNRAKKAFKDQTGIILVTVWGRGYSIPSGDDQMRNKVHDLQRAENIQAKAEDGIACITPDRLSDRGRDVQSSLLGKMRLIHSVLREKRLGLEAEVGQPRLAMTG